MDLIRLVNRDEDFDKERSNAEEARSTANLSAFEKDWNYFVSTFLTQGGGDDRRSQSITHTTSMLIFKSERIQSCKEIMQSTVGIFSGSLVNEVNKMAFEVSSII